MPRVVKNKFNIHPVVERVLCLNIRIDIAVKTLRIMHKIGHVITGYTGRMYVERAQSESRDRCSDGFYVSLRHSTTALPTGNASRMTLSGATFYRKQATLKKNTRS